MTKKKKTTKKAAKKEKRKIPKLFGISKEKEYLAENISSLVSSGVPLVDAVDAVAKDIKNKVLRRILGYVVEDIQRGSMAWKAFEASKLFEEHTIALLRVGEETGQLSQNLGVVASQERKNSDFRAKVRSAMMYPIIVVIVTLVIGIAIAWFILPKLSLVFQNLALDLPLLTEIIIDIGIFLQNYGAIAVPSFIVGITLLIYFVFFFRKTKFIGQYILFSLPGIRKLVMNIEISRFGFLLGTLLDAGLPVVRAFDSLIEASTFSVYKKFYIYIRDQVEKGGSFKYAFDTYPKSGDLFPASVMQIVSSSEQSGQLAKALLRMGETAEKKTDQLAKNLSVILEPVLLVMVWLGVVAVAIGVILPIYGLVGGLNDPSKKVDQSIKPTQEIIEELSFADIVKKEEEKEALPRIEILSTGTGFLNIRSQASTNSEIIGQAAPGDIYEYVEEVDNWFEVLLCEEEGACDPDFGWVFGEYVSKQETEE
jgi:type IV pilus assembly protein PilC